MRKADLISILADAITSHEGYDEGNLSDVNNNPGNLKYVGQKYATAGDRGFCVFPDKYIGRAALEKDVSLKVSRNLLGNLGDIISEYAPPSDNDTESYIEAVVDWFRGFGWPVTRYTSIQGILDIDKPSCVVCLNGIIRPKDWKNAQSALGLLAVQCPQIGFSTRYTNENLQDSLVTFPSPAGDLVGISEDKARSILATFNEGQELNLLAYNGFLLKPPGRLSGGNEYPGKEVSKTHPHTSLASVNFNSLLTPNQILRETLHEINHELFTLTGNPDYVHAYMQQHAGYEAQDLQDLKAIYDSVMGNYLGLKDRIEVLQNVEIGLLQRLVNLLKEKLKWKK
jgi:hypothetical protein